MDETLTQDNLRFINEVMTSWAVQAVIAGLLVGIAIVAFGRASRIFDDDRTRRVFRVVVVALAVVVVAQAALTAASGHVSLPVVVVVEFVWLCGLWFYYFFRFMTGRRRGPGDPEAQRRGEALDGTISRIGRERAGDDVTVPPR